MDVPVDVVRIIPGDLHFVNLRSGVQRIGLGGIHKEIEVVLVIAGDDFLGNLSTTNLQDLSGVGCESYLLHDVRIDGPIARNGVDRTREVVRAPGVLRSLTHGQRPGSVFRVRELRAGNNKGNNDHEDHDERYGDDPHYGRFADSD